MRARLGAIVAGGTTLACLSCSSLRFDIVQHSLTYAEWDEVNATVHKEIGHWTSGDFLKLRLVSDRDLVALAAKAGARVNASAHFARDLTRRSR